MVVVSGGSLFWVLRPGRHSIRVTGDLCHHPSASWCGLVPVGQPATLTTTGLKWNIGGWRKCRVVEMGGVGVAGGLYCCEETDCSCMFRSFSSLPLPPTRSYTMLCFALTIWLWIITSLVLCSCKYLYITLACIYLQFSLFLVTLSNSSTILCCVLSFSTTKTFSARIAPYLSLSSMHQSLYSGLHCSHTIYEY